MVSDDKKNFTNYFLRQTNFFALRSLIYFPWAIVPLSVANSRQKIFYSDNNVLLHVFIFLICTFCFSFFSNGSLQKNFLKNITTKSSIQFKYTFKCANLKCIPIVGIFLNFCLLKKVKNEVNIVLTKIDDDVFNRLSEEWDSKHNVCHLLFAFYYLWAATLFWFLIIFESFNIFFCLYSGLCFVIYFSIKIILVIKLFKFHRK